ncbi:MAG TPA: DUF885 domain-containing protein [Woeseiaceae bacterium]|nr:DUF885 domain-containing protein [Woeseiaceae bacterium]
MTRLAAAFLAATLCLSACGGGEQAAESAPAAAGDDADDDAGDSGAGAATMLATLFEEHFERELRLDPVQATAIGDFRYNDELAITNSAEHRAAERALDEEFLERLLAIDRSGLDYQDQLSYDIFRRFRENALEGYEYPYWMQPVNQFWLFTNEFVQLGSGAGVHPFDTVEHYDDFLGRVDDFVVNLDAAIDNMRTGMREGVVQPKVLMEKVVPQLESQIVADARESDFWQPVENMPPAFAQADRERLTAAYREAIMTKIVPAFARLNNFIGDEYLAAARETVGYGALPDGEEWYRYLVRRWTTTDLAPAEIHAIGLAEVERIHGEMQGVMKEVGFEGGLRDFFEYVNTDERFFFDEPDQLIQGYRDMADDVEELASKLFDIEPKTAFEVRRVEPFREASASGGSYQRGAPDGSRPGIFYANAYNMQARPKWAMESLFLHEAIPGHHFQIALQQENENLPRFRRFGFVSAYSEGWGLYAETLGRELGVYTDPYQYFGALNAELWRAIRLVVDTGIHSLGWTRQEVLDYMYANSAVAPARAISEAERFMALPGQALAYKIGQLKIRELREMAQERLGGDFDVVAFHRAVLIDGPMPLSLLEDKIERWVAALE